ncbi:hypothetical protein QFC22_004295 [Naganishia vaughanmartiniae]|uniref:Uncharacterized protein n=1 Tax=Naganishia vaughanmartiniae TaxID=1424756 RepID=A0ACC2X081_9TREE|nr:hypothetical protein QFC22_004295 [Naganishia vaughanmartiniae]
MPRNLLSRSSAGQGSASNAYSSPHISPKDLSPSRFENGQPIPSASYYPPTWEAHPILPAPLRRPEKYRKSPFPGRHSWPTLPNAIIDGALGDGRGWGGKGPARSDTSVFPGVDSWPTPFVGMTQTPTPMATPTPVTLPLPTAMTFRPTPISSATPYTPSPYGPMQAAYPPPAQQHQQQHENDDDSSLYNLVCCGKRKKQKRTVGQRSTV